MKRRKFVQLGSLLPATGLAGGLAGATVPPPAVTGKTLHEAAREIPVVEGAEVVVCGAGPAGIAAALAAARIGVRTMLIDVHGCLGGIWTAGALSWILDEGNKTGIMREILDAMEERSRHEPRTKGRFKNVCNAETMKILLEDLCLEAGVSIRYFTRVVAAVRDADNRVSHAVVESKSGREAIAGGTFIDCTGDGDLAALAGCGFDVGHPETGKTQPFSMMAVLGGIDAEAIAPFYRHPGQGWAECKDRLRAEMEKGGHSPSYAKPTLFQIRRDLLAKDVDGLMMAGRCISGDFLAHSSYRVTGNAVALGEAAGKASALAVASRRLPHQVAFKELAAS